MRRTHTLTLNRDREDHFMDHEPPRTFAVISFLIKQSLQDARSQVHALRRLQANQLLPPDESTLNQIGRHLDNEHTVHAIHREQIDEWSREPIEAHQHRELERLRDLLSLTYATLAEGYRILESIGRRTESPSP
ncbi:hypothetical protein LZC95_05290 [Pendulispora brunnea]|uniref:Uncharacterized protein n=1 Tax=Pendulispora brunnea TaxID=2905690 RepID=A0ABZ2KH61_9BACT